MGSSSRPTEVSGTYQVVSLYLHLTSNSLFLKHSKRGATKWIGSAISVICARQMGPSNRPVPNGVGFCYELNVRLPDDWMKAHPQVLVQRSKSAKKGSNIKHKKSSSGTVAPASTSTSGSNHASGLCELGCLFTLTAEQGGLFLLRIVVRMFRGWKTRMPSKRIGLVQSQRRAGMHQSLMATTFLLLGKDYFYVSDYGSKLYVVETGSSFILSGSPIEVCWELPEPTPLVAIYYKCPLSGCTRVDAT
jgi:hypothetical protein